MVIVGWITSKVETPERGRGVVKATVLATRKGKGAKMVFQVF